MLVHFAVVLPWQDGCFWAEHRNEAKIEREVSRLVAFVCLVHKQVQWPIRHIRPSKALQQGTPFLCITHLDGRERERYCCSSIRSNHETREIKHVCLLRRFHYVVSERKRLDRGGSLPDSP